jgi:hypothetical protein
VHAEHPQTLKPAWTQVLCMILRGGTTDTCFDICGDHALFDIDLNDDNCENAVIAFLPG